MKTFAVLTSVAMFGFIFSAHANKDNHPSLIAMNVAAPVHESASLPVSFTDAAIEESLEVENWMTNESFFAPVAVPETEAPMEVENWMTAPENFMEITFTEESDHSFQVESWMLEQVNFSAFTISQETEQALEIEGWMLKENTWGK